ncbi:MAG: hypothetical protein WD267_07120 [Balneolales bacterium]
MSKLSGSLNKYNDIFWERISQNVYTSEKSLGLFRCIFGSLALVLYPPSFSWISQTPPAFFDPPIISIANLFSGFPYQAFAVIDLIVIISLILLTLGVKARFFGLLTVALIIFGQSFTYSFGKIDHSILFVSVIAIMSFSGWGTYYSLMPDSGKRLKSSSLHVSIVTVVLCLGMITAGSAKAYNWLDFDLSTSGILSWYYLAYFDIDRNLLLASHFIKLPMFLYEMMDYSAVIFELSAILAALYSRNSWLGWILLACLFHLSTALILNIPYGVHVYLYLLFIDWHSLGQSIKISFPLKTFSISIILIGLAHWYQRIFNEGSAVLFQPKSNSILAFELYLYVFLWSIMIVLFIWEIYNNTVNINIKQDCLLAEDIANGNN